MSLQIAGSQKVCIVAPMGPENHFAPRGVAGGGREGAELWYMPQDYTEHMDPQQNAVEFLTRSGTKEELTTIRTTWGA